jgi:hypothetical protein
MIEQPIPYRIDLDYPLHPEPRYGWGKPVHSTLYEILNRNRAVYENHLRWFLTEKAHYLQIAKHLSDDSINQPAWINGSLPGLDAVALYGLISRYQPRQYFEIGVGNSTKWAKQAINDHHLATSITAIDPFPMPGVTAICDKLIQQPLEQIELELFDQLEAGDILFVDNSHRVFMNSDATVVFLDILPRLKAGVLVEFHDIALPIDYPPQWSNKYYSEQYILAAYLLADGQKFDVILPNAFITMDSELSQLMNPLWQDSQMNGDKHFDLLATVKDGLSGNPIMTDLVETHGSSFWITMK